MDTQQQEPLYISEPTARSLWQEYRLYPDRLELRFWLFLKILTIPVKKIVDLIKVALSRTLNIRDYENKQIKTIPSIQSIALYQISL